MQSNWIIWFPLLCFNFKSFLDPNSSSLIRFKCVLYDSEEFLSNFWNFYKLKSGDQISGGNQFWRKPELSGSAFCVSILKVLWTQIFRHHYISRDSPWFRSTFLRVFKFLQIKEVGPHFWWEPILQNVWIWSPPFLYFNFESFNYPISLSLIRFQCILHDSGVIFQESWNFCRLKRGDLISWWNQFCRMSELFDPCFYISILKVF